MWCGPLRAPVTLSCTTSAASGSRSIRNDRHSNDKAITDNHYQSLLCILLCFDWLEWNNMPGNESPLCHFCYIMSIHNLAQVGTSPTTKPHPLRIWWNEKKASQSTDPQQKENCLTSQNILQLWQHSHLCSLVFDWAYSLTSGKGIFLFIYVKKTNHCD